MSLLDYEHLPLSEWPALADVLAAAREVTGERDAEEMAQAQRSETVRVGPIDGEDTG
jgi:hypothetical protein